MNKHTVMNDSVLKGVIIIRDFTVTLFMLNHVAQNASSHNYGGDDYFKQFT